MKRVLVTGASGFIGHHCLEPLLERGFEVHAVATRANPEPVKSVRWHHFDLLAPGKAAGLIETVRPTHLLHLAWYVEPGKLISAGANFDWVSASLELVRRFIDGGGTRLVGGGTAYEYDWRFGYCTEHLTPATPTTTYGACKRALHVLLDALAENGALSAAWARVFFLYGPREHPERLVSSVIRALLREQPANCSHGRQVRDYLHVQDVANAVVSLLDSDVSGPVNIASGRPVQLRDIVMTVGRLLDRTDLIKLGAIAARANDTPLVVGDNSRLVQELHWEPSFDLESGLKHTIGWWQNSQSQEVQRQ